MFVAKLQQVFLGLSVDVFQAFANLRCLRGIAFVFGPTCFFLKKPVRLFREPGRTGGGIGEPGMHPGCRAVREGCAGGRRSRTKTPVWAGRAGCCAHPFSRAHGQRPRFGRRFGHPPLAHGSLPGLSGWTWCSFRGAAGSRLGRSDRLVQGPVLLLLLFSRDVRPGADSSRKILSCERFSAPEPGESSPMGQFGHPPRIPPAATWTPGRRRS